MRFLKGFAQEGSAENANWNDRPRKDERQYGATLDAPWPREYGLMQAYAEGFDIFKNATSKEVDEHHRYELNLPDIAELWRRGSVVGSWLLDLTAMALAENPSLSEFTGNVADSGEGRWTILAAIEEAVPCEVLSAALYTRFRSRQQHTFAEKMLSAMRNKFGGHLERAAGGD